MAHRIRHAMGNSDTTPIGSGGGVVKADATYIDGKKNAPVKAGWKHKQAVVSLVERGGKVRSDRVTGYTSYKAINVGNPLGVRFI